MFKNKSTYLIITALLFIMLIAIQHFAPKPINWNVTYSYNSKSPYGCYILKSMNNSFFPKQDITYNEASFFVSLDSSSTETQNLIIITSDFDPDQYDLKSLMNFVAMGNNLFISSTDFATSILDTLMIELKSELIDTSVFKPGDDVLYLENKNLQKDSGYHYNRKMPMVYFSSFNCENTSILGTNRNKDVNFICTQLGIGKIYLHTQPFVFTNYHLLCGNIEYASAVISYLPVQKTIWDNYYKPNRIVNTSPTRYILSQPPLRTAYHVLLLTLLLYIIIESKRRQRIIPVIKPPDNESLKFIKTIGYLYFKQHNNVDLAKKKITFLKDFIRQRYYITTISANTNCIHLVASKSGIPIKQIKKLLESAQYIESAPMLTDGGLIELNQRIELFYEQCL